MRHLSIKQGKHDHTCRHIVMQRIRRAVPQDAQRLGPTVDVRCARSCACAPVRCKDASVCELPLRRSYPRVLRKAVYDSVL